MLAGNDDIGAALVSDPRVRLVSFTGSVAVGKQIAAQAGQAMKRVVAELGGNDAAIVLADVDAKKVAPLLFNSAFILGARRARPAIASEPSSHWLADGGQVQRNRPYKPPLRSPLSQRSTFL